METPFEKPPQLDNASCLADDAEKKEQKKYLREGERLTIETGEFSIILEGRDCFESEVYSESLGKYSEASAIVRNDKLSEPQDIIYDFGGSGKRISSRIKLRPGENNITIGLLDGETGEVKEFELRATIPGRLYSSSSVEFLLQENSQTVGDDALDKIATITQVMNRYLEQGMTQIFIKDKEFPAGSAIGGRIELSRFNFSNPDRKPAATAWHELAHLYYDQLRGDLDYYLRHNHWKPHGEDFEDLFKQALEASFVEGADKTNRRWKDIMPNSVMELFNSEKYREGQDPSHGHPQSHAGELFAYGSEILLFYPDEFNRRLSRLEGEKERNLALQIAGQIVESYTQNEILPEELKLLDQFRIKK